MGMWSLLPKQLQVTGDGRNAWKLRGQAKKILLVEGLVGDFSENSRCVCITPAENVPTLTRDFGHLCVQCIPVATSGGHGRGPPPFGQALVIWCILALSLLNCVLYLCVCGLVVLQSVVPFCQLLGIKIENAESLELSLSGLLPCFFLLFALTHSL